MRTIDAETGLCGIIGNPVGHTLSPALHNAAFEATDSNFVYLAFEVSDLAGCLAGMRALPNFRGLSVTIPHKVAILDHLDELEALAEKVGSVNTVTRREGRLVGGTTDGLGAVRALDEADVSLVGQRVVFLGTGGATRAVAFAVADRCAPSSITILGRTPAHVETLVEDVAKGTGARVDGGALAGDIGAVVANHDVIIHGTPVGMTPEREGETCVPGDALSPHHVVFDMVYRPHRTRLLRDAEAAGSTVVFGIEMLIHQAALQFETWTGSAAPIRAMRETAENHMGDGG